MEVDFALLCSDLKEQPDNSWDISGFTGTFNSSSFPFELPRIIVFMSFILSQPDEGSSFVIGIQFRDPDERPLTEEYKLIIDAPKLESALPRLNAFACPPAVTIRNGIW